jgi:hypothetical protein
VSTSDPHIGFPKSRSSIKVKTTAPSPSQAARNTQTNSDSSRSLPMEPGRISQPSKLISRRFSPSSKPKRIDLLGTKSSTLARKETSGQFALASTDIQGFGFELHHLPTALQNLSADELMFVSHLYNWGLSRAKQLAARFHYKLQQHCRCYSQRCTNSTEIVMGEV